MRLEFQGEMEELSRLSVDDYTGMWEIVHIVRDLSGPQTDDEFKALVLEFVREMLDRGFKAVDLTSGGGCAPWTDQNPTSVISRIDHEWTVLGREPTIGEIAWFDLEPEQ